MERGDSQDGRGISARLERLRERFEDNRANLTILEEINTALRSDTTDEGTDLQVDVIMAIMALRPPVAAVQPTRGTPVLTGVLADRGLPKPNGRPLHRYRVTDARYAQLKAEIERLYKSYGQQGLVSRGGPVFVLYCAEWFRREYHGGNYAWRMPYPAIFGLLSNGETRVLTQQGLKWWGLKPRQSGGLELRLQSLVLEGGFPTRLLESREHGRIATHLRGLMARLEGRVDPNEEEALTMSRQSTTALGQFDHEGFHLLCAELALAILALRRRVKAHAPPGVTASAWLDAAHPEWREDLPITLSGEGARRLVDDLVSQRVERLASDAVCQRLLIRTNAGWSPAVDIGVSGEIAFTAEMVNPSAGRLRAFAAGELSNVLAGELAMLEPPTEEGEHWLCRPRGGVRRRAPLDFARPVSVELRGGDTAPISLVWPKGEPQRSELLVFADDRGDEPPSEPDTLVLIGAGSVSTRHRRAYLWTPADFEVTTKVGDEAVAPTWQGARRLFEITSAVYAGPPGGDRYRVEVGAEKDQIEKLDLRGPTLRGAEAADHRVEIFAGLPLLSVRSGARGQSAKPGEVQWRRLPNGAWKDWYGQAPRAGDGLVEVVWRDTIAKVRRDRRVAAILPAAAELRTKPSGALGVAYSLTEMADWSLTLEDRSIQSETTEDCLVINFQSKPLHRLSLCLTQFGKEPIAITARTRLKAGGFARANNTLFNAQDHVLLDDLRGATAFADGRDRVYLRNSTGDMAHFGFTDELPLWSLSDDILRLLAGGGELDHVVTAELGPAEGRRLRIGRYAAQLEIVGREVSVLNEPPPADNAVVRCLEWFSILQPGIRTLDRRSWDERFLQPNWTLPDDLEGPGLVVLREGSRIIGRPTLFVGQTPNGAGDLRGMRRAVVVENFIARRSAIDEALDHLGDATPEAEADRTYLLGLIAALEGVPAAAFNILERLSLNTAAQAALMAAALDEASQGAVWKLDRELPIMWALIPFADWGRAFDSQSSQLRDALVAGDITGILADRLINDTMQRRARALVNLDPLLALPLMAYTGLGGDGLHGLSLAQAAQDRARRSGDQMTASHTAAGAPVDLARASCFRTLESPVRDRLPPSWPFLAGHWEGLDAACAAAIAAAGLARLKPSHVRRIRAAQAQEPLSFSDLYATALLCLAQNKPLNC